MRLKDLNTLSNEEATAALLRCCGSTRWAQRMAERRPFVSPLAMAEAADETWSSLDREDWLEAFAAHPRIGDIKNSPAEPDAGTISASEEANRGLAPSPWASNEQSGMNAASHEVRQRLADANRDYEARFGYIFIVCATGKSAEGMLAILGDRLSNAPSDELRIAAAEQGKITQLRLSKLLMERSGRPDL